MTDKVRDKIKRLIIIQDLFLSLYDDSISYSEKVMIERQIDWLMAKEGLR